MSRLAKAKQILEEMAIKSRDVFGEGPIWQKGLSSKNERLVKEAEEANKALKERVLEKEKVPLSPAADVTPIERRKNIERVDRQIENAEKERQQKELIEKYKKEQEAEKAKRSKSKSQQLSESTSVLDEAPTTVVPETAPLGAKAAAVAPMSAMSQFANPADIVKSGYDKFEKARQSVVNKIADVTDMGLNENPYVPQYAKDTYNKAADELLQNVSDPLNAIPGFGAVDAAAGAASTAYNMAKPVTTAATKNPVQTFKVKP